ncbi:hypothetical protein TKK_0013499 [Trichogramma kaykai]
MTLRSDEIIPVPTDVTAEIKAQLDSIVAQVHVINLRCKKIEDLIADANKKNDDTRNELAATSQPAQEVLADTAQYRVERERLAPVLASRYSRGPKQYLQVHPESAPRRQMSPRRAAVQVLQERPGVSSAD